MLVTNIVEDGKAIGAFGDGEMWFHHDTSYYPEPHRATLLYAMKLTTSGGETSFSNMYKAYEMIPRALRDRLEGKKVLQMHDYKRRERIDVDSADLSRIRHHVQPLFITHPATGRKALYVSRLMTARIEGFSRTESEEILEQLFDISEDPSIVYQHSWALGDLVIWDNWCSIHARADFPREEPRLMRRLTIEGHAAVHEALEVGPDGLLQAGRARRTGGAAGAQRLREGQQPAGLAGDEGDVEAPRAGDDRIQFLRPVVQLLDVRAGLIEVVLDPLGQVECDQAAQVALVGGERRGLGDEREGIGAAQQQVAAVKDLGAAGARAVVEQGVARRAPEMLEQVPGDGQRLDRAVRGAGGDRIKRTLAGPEHVGGAALHLVDVRREVRMGMERHAPLELRVGQAGLEAHLAAEGGLREGPEQAAERALLRGHRRFLLAQPQGGAGRLQARA